MLLETLSREPVSLVAWSWGALIAYAHIRSYGTARLRAFVSIDETPTPLALPGIQWHRGSIAQWRAFARDLSRDRTRATSAFIKSMFNDPSAHAETVVRLAASSEAADLDAALVMLLEALIEDFTLEASRVAEEVPTLHFLDVRWSADARAWLRAHCPHAAIVDCKGHVPFIEEPRLFGRDLAAFLDATSPAR
jgi:pimeloyl-ACP methyl ester carboxylesterase